MEGTLSLFDWCPAPAAPSGPVAEGSGPCVQRAEVLVEVEVAVAVEVPPAAPVAEAGPRIVVFDCETTGTDRIQDQVIELCIQRGLSDDAPSQTWRIKPTAPIHPGAQAVHGITLADLAGSPGFAEVADAIAAVFAETDVIVGYNIAFDIDMLQAEYTRIGRPLLDLNGKKIVDAFRLWQQCEPRSLQHAHQRFVGNGFASAHSASADVAATGRVLTGMLRMFNLADQDWESIACKCDPQYASRASWVGPSRHLRWEGEAVVLGFGKHANAAVHTLAAGPDRSFLRWVVEKDFPVHVGEVCRAALDLTGEEFLAWARQRYPCTPVVAAPVAEALIAASDTAPGVETAPGLASGIAATSTPAWSAITEPPAATEPAASIAPKPRASRRAGAKAASPAQVSAPK